MGEKIKELEEEFLPFRYNRVRYHFRHLARNIEVFDKNDKYILGHLEKVTNHIIDKIKMYGKLNTFFYSMIYFSFFSMFFNDWLLFAGIREMIGMIIGFVGTTIFLIAIQFTNKIIELFYQDLSLVSSHRLIIYTKYQKKDMINDGFIGERNSNVFLDYFRKKYDYK